MNIALICPSSFNDYDIVEKELDKNRNIRILTCATENAYEFIKCYANKHNIEYYKESRGNKTFNLRKVVQVADKVLLFEYFDYDGITYSLTQKVLVEAKKLKKELNVIYYNRYKKKELKMDSATAFFRERQILHNKDKLCESESKWTAFAQMALIWISKESIRTKKVKKLNIYQSLYKDETKQKNWLKKTDEFLINSWTVSHNNIAEGLISDFFKSKDKVFNMRPDLTLIDEKNKKIILFEIKTVGAKVKPNIDKYKKLITAIRAEKYECELYYLMSYGHEPENVKQPKHEDWKLLDEYSSNIILWEELFLELQRLQCPLLEYITSLGNIDNWQEYIKKNFIDI
jgi:hypothetical protein